MSEYDTKPTIENVLERIKALQVEMQAGFKEVFRRVDMVSAKLDRLNKRLLDVEGTSDDHEDRITALEQPQP